MFVTDHYRKKHWTIRGGLLSLVYLLLLIGLEQLHISSVCLYNKELCIHDVGTLHCSGCCSQMVNSN